jgi:Ser/Thr protein kinase RdoA (MazF antagonist)
MSVDNILKYASTCYDFDLNNIESVNSGSHGVYKIRKDGQNFYLRLSWCGDYVPAEIHVIEYLRNDVKVPKPVISNNGKLIETFQNNGENYDVFCMFHELPGVLWKKSDYVWNEKTYFNWGRTMGLMHRLTKSYRPTEELLKHPRFEDNYNPLSNYTPLPLVQEKMARIQNEISSLPKDADSYGLIHSDMHQQNFLVDGNNISVLDFDGCLYGHFALDIGIALYHAIWWNIPDDYDDKTGFALEIIKNFMSGYNTENSLSDFWLEKITLFMRYRQIQAISWHLGFYPSKGFTAVVYNEQFGIYFDYAQYIKNVEDGVFLAGCTIDEGVFLNVKNEPLRDV